MARDAQADGRADHPDLVSVPRITIELDPYADQAGEREAFIRIWVARSDHAIGDHYQGFRGLRRICRNRSPLYDHPASRLIRR
jgi:hypothetical protein